MNIGLKIESHNLNFECQKDKPDFDYIKDMSRNIYSASSLFSIRLDTYDFLTNPELSISFDRKPIKIYKKFEKSLHVLKYQAHKRGIKLSLEGISKNTILGYDLFEILPFILFENAIKYSLDDSEILCRFEEKNEYRTKITIQNRGIVPEKLERDDLFLRGVRSKNVKNAYNGNGIGLFLANEICKFHNIGLSVNYSETTPHSKIGNFYVTIEIDIKAANIG